jgi:hypothetical protein
LTSVADRTPAELLVRVNIALITICLVLFVICVVRQLWLPAAVFATFTATNGYQLVTRRR